MGALTQKFKRYAWLTHLLCLAFLLTATARVFAASYNVNATVNFPAPTQAAEINPNLDTITVNNAVVRLYGSCEIGTPYFVISIVRAGTSIGSTNCASNGSFSLNVTLQPGANQLMARSASVSSLYGPDSQLVTLMLVLPPTPPPVQAQKVAPPLKDTGLNATQIAETNQAAEEKLAVVTSTPFSQLDNTKTSTVNVTVSGGKGPYTINIDWGDGSNDSKTVSDPGTYSLTHTYAKIGSFHVTGQVHDVLGAVTLFNHLVVSTNPTAPSKAAPVVAANPPNGFQPSKSVTYFASAAGGAAVVAGGAALFLSHVGTAAGGSGHLPKGRWKKW